MGVLEVAKAMMWEDHQQQQQGTMTTNNWGWIVSMLWLVMGGGMWVLIERRRRGGRHDSSKATGSVPNPTNWFLIGMLPALIANLGSGYYDWMTAVLLANGGSFEFKGPWLWLVGGSRCQDTLVTADPRNVEHVLRSNFANYPKGPDFRAIFADLLGAGIFNADHELWRVQRKATSLHLNSRGCREFADRTNFEAAARKLLPMLRHFSGIECEGSLEKTSSGSELPCPVVDFQDLMLRFTFDTISQIAFGIDTGCLRPDLPSVPFASAFETALECTSLRFSTPPSAWKLLRLLRLGWERRLPAALREIDAYVQKVVDERRKAFVSDPEAASDLLTCFLRMEQESSSAAGGGGAASATNGCGGGGGGDKDNDKFLKDVIVNILLAGRDTSALALSWFFWLVATHPHVEAKLVEEARRVLLPPGDGEGDGDGDGDGDGELPPEDHILHSREKLNQMVYLQAALSEALRLYPSVPTDFKHVEKDDVLPDGRRILKGQRFVYSIYSMGRMESIWGRDCAEFKPERWLLGGGGGGADHDHKTPTPLLLANVSPFQYVAFNAGPRTCLGKDMALTLMKVVASAILLRYRVLLAPAHPKVLPKVAPTLYMKHGLHVLIQPRHRHRHRHR